jgi:hypothetical protein
VACQNREVSRHTIAFPLCCRASSQTFTLLHGDSFSLPVGISHLTWPDPVIRNRVSLHCSDFGLM